MIPCAHVNDGRSKTEGSYFLPEIGGLAEHIESYTLNKEDMEGFNLIFCKKKSLVIQI